MQAINKRYNRSGPLFYERFHHVHVHSDRYQILLCRYIHVNPIKDGLAVDLRDWPYLNYLEFIEARKGESFVPGYREEFFPTAKAYEEFVAAYGTVEDKDLEKYLFGAK